VRVLVLDLTHGGEVLARAYARRGDDVTAVDVYRTAPPALRSQLAEEGVAVRDAAPEADFELGVAPIHCPDAFFGRARCERRITHHQAVGELASFPFPVVEVTGTRGKTSTCQLLARVLADQGKKVLLLTSGGLQVVEEDRTTVLETKVSIAPPTILHVAEKGYQADVGVFEDSLGGTGVGAVSVITTTAGDYPIARGTRWAVDGKRQMARLARHAVVFPTEEGRVWAPHIARAANATTFGRGGDIEVTLSDLDLRRGGVFSLSEADEMVEAKLTPGYLAPCYETAFGAAAAVARCLGVPLDAVASTISSFRGAPGRGEVHVIDGRVVVRDHNPGVSAGSIAWNARALDAYGCQDVGAVIDPVNVKVCEKLELTAVRAALQASPAVKGSYLLPPPGWTGGSDGFQAIKDVREAMENHEVVLWCTKEGYL